jgi:hypothetical protein
MEKVSAILLKTIKTISKNLCLLSQVFVKNISCLVFALHKLESKQGTEINIAREAVCDKTAANLAGKFPANLMMITDSTWYYTGGGCC